ncbi:MAG: DUF1403 family protein [Litoreibacter sp.]
MTYQPTAIDDNSNNLPKLPAWVTAKRAETLETVAYRSGAALTVLDQLASDRAHGVPVKLLANRLGLKAAAVTSNSKARTYHARASPTNSENFATEPFSLWRGYTAEMAV